MQKIDIFLWKDFQEDLKYNLDDSYFISRQKVKLFRLFKLIIHSIIPLFYLFSGRILSAYRYLTIWGMYMTFFYYIFINICHYYNFSDKKTSIFIKKLTIILFELSFSLQFTITFFFWVVLYPILKNDIFENWVSFLIVGLYMHFGCLLSLWIDLYYNTILFEKRHFTILILFMLIYGIFNLIYKLITDINIYPVIKWDDFHTYIYIIMCILMTSIHFMIGVWFSHYKTNNMTLYKPLKS